MTTAMADEEIICLGHAFDFWCNVMGSKMFT